ncbi:phage baseplate upper protein [Bacillus subtilis]|uniref:Phage baseplate upper protein n=1 Tax=Bacillus subtilis TaxID=1423 RepID=A0AAQ3ESI5_BACIU|nr:phage baseplate upper protein [Bacillus subtilis]KIN37965.1 hypothetical protein B4071_2801 [Bacillus subtilis]WHM19885.1 phage baseplate upper protein [Bacillus subtilis]WHM22871.1 phage baseplate upper protein [Bacillus subtilis]
MIYNDASLSFEVTSRSKTSIHTNIQFSTQDIDTARLIFSLSKNGVPLPLSAVSGKIVMHMADGSQFIKNIEIVGDPINGVAQYVLTADEVKHYGTVNAELNLHYANKQALSVHKFSFVIDRALIDADIIPISEYYIDDFESLRAKINELYDEVIDTVEDLRKKFEDLENVETKAGAQEKADAAEANAKAYTDAHANNKTIHITADERTDWNAKETTSGSQNKANKALIDAKSYTDTHASDAVKHITADERTKWNKGQLYKLTQDNGTRIFIPEGTDLLTLPSGFYYGANNKLLNNPDPNDAGWFNYDIMGGNSGRKTILATASYNNKMWIAAIHTNGDFKGWKRLITDADTVVSWQTPSLLNGWEQYDTDQKVRFSKNVLGEVEIIGAIKGGNIGIDVSVFNLPEGFRPLQPSHFIGVASSSGMGSGPQFHRTLVDTDGKVCIQSCSNTVKPNAFIVLGFKFKSA